MAGELQRRTGFRNIADTTQTSSALAGTLTGTIDGTMVDVAASAAATAGGSTPTAAQVDTGIATAVATIVTGVNVQNKEMQAMINKLVVDVAALTAMINGTA